MYWSKYSFDYLQKFIQKALNENTSYHNHNIMGLPATFLDSKIFPHTADFLKNAPYIKCFIENPNHIGVHTNSESLPVFKGTQKIEIDLLRICAEDIFCARKNEYDGYMAPGGTECNIQAIWIYREFFKNKFSAKIDEIIVIFSEDTHYSVYKACNLLNLDYQVLPVDKNTRKIKTKKSHSLLKKIRKNNKKYIISVINMGTTMFGSVDNVDEISSIFKELKFEYKFHVDAAFGGFIYPFTNPKSNINFKNPLIDSISVDGHKMLQAPYGTGLFLIRKGLIENVVTKEASYIEGYDFTLCGSRSGANVIATWMILNIYGSDGIISKMRSFIDKTDYLCNSLKKLGVQFYRNEFMNIITIPDGEISHNICNKFALVPDSHNKHPKWWKIVVMEHVDWNLIVRFISELNNEKYSIFSKLSKKTKQNNFGLNNSENEFIENFNQGKVLFNNGMIHDAHVIWEEIWKKGNPYIKKEIQGFIQLSGAIWKNKFKKNTSTQYLLNKAMTNLNASSFFSQFIEKNNLINKITNILNEKQKTKHFPNTIQIKI